MAMAVANKPLPPSLMARREWAWLYCSNGLLSVFFSLGYVANCSGEMQELAACCLPWAVVNYAFCLNLVPALASAGFYFFGRNRTVARTAAALFYAMLQILLLADVILFRLFHRHFDKLTWQLLTSEGAGDTIRAGFWNNVVIAGLILLLIGISCCFSYWLAPRVSRHRAAGMIALMTAIVIADKGLFAYSDLKDPTTIYWLREYLPVLHWFAPARRGSFYGVEDPHRVRPDIGPPDNLETERTLDLPKNPIGFQQNDAAAKHPFLLVDSARRDALSPEVMPHLWRWEG